MTILGLKTAQGNLALYLPLSIYNLHWQSSLQSMNLQHWELHKIYRPMDLKQHGRTTTVLEARGLQWVSRIPFLSEALGRAHFFMFHLPGPPAFLGYCLQSPSPLHLLLFEGYRDHLRAPRKPRILSLSQDPIADAPVTFIKEGSVHEIREWRQTSMIVNTVDLIGSRITKSTRILII